MASCPHILDCPLFAVFTMNAALAIWKINYCGSDHSRCVRYQLTAGGKPVPQNLLPNGKVLHLTPLPSR
jgi:hypothetical protein